MAVLKIKSVPQKYTDELAYQQLLDYIMRSDKTPDHYIGGFAVHPQYAAEEMQLVSQAYHQARGVRLRHWIISFEKHELADAWHANQFAQMACRFYADTYQIVYSVHEDAEHLHVHFVMNMISYQNGEAILRAEERFLRLSEISSRNRRFVWHIYHSRQGRFIQPEYFTFFGANGRLRPLGKKIGVCSPMKVEVLTLTVCNQQNRSIFLGNLLRAPASRFPAVAVYLPVPAHGRLLQGCPDARRPDRRLLHRRIPAEQREHSAPHCSWKSRPRLRQGVNAA